LEKGIQNFEASIMKSFQSSPFASLFKEMLGNMGSSFAGGQDRGQSDSAMNEIFKNMKPPYGDADPLSPF
jgi:hypothetical protein